MRFLILFCLLVMAGTASAEAVEPHQPVATFGRLHVAVVDPAKNTDAEHYRQIAQDICGNAANCQIFFWDDASIAPTSMPFSSEALLKQVAEWSQNRERGLEKLLISCKLLNLPFDSKNPPDCLPRW